MRKRRLCGFVLAMSSASAQAAVTFTDVTVSAGVDYLQYQVTDPPLAAEQEYMTGGAAAGDYDGDGWIDLFATRLDAPDLLFRNLGNGTFQEVAASAGVAGSGLSNGAAWGDIDNDGDLDLFVTTVGAGASRFYLYVNDGNGAFTEEAVARGTALQTGDLHYGWSVTFGDYDHDGYLDIHTTEWRYQPQPSNHGRLFHNLGEASPGYFEDVTAAAGVEVYEGPSTAQRMHSFASRFTDLDRDGWPDLAIAGDFGESHLFWNDGDGTFTDGTVAAGVGTDENGMGSALGDYDGDGLLDWFVTSIYDPDDTCEEAGCNWGATGNRLYRNLGGRLFADATDAAGVRDGYWGWGAAFFDYDNDSDLDLVMTNGVDFASASPPVAALFARFNPDPMRLWKNDGTGVMAEVSASLGVTDDGSGKGLLTFDYDEDGDLDLFVVNNAGHPVLYRNDGGNQNAWLRVRAVGTESNRDALGARITVTTGSFDVLVREVNAGSHFLGQSERVAHFGLLGPAPVKVRVDWPKSGYSMTYEDVAANTTLVVVEAPPVPVGPGLPGLAPLLGVPVLLASAALARRRRDRRA